MQKVIIIMAGGLGKRMDSKIPKVLHEIHGFPMICHLLKTSLLLNPSCILIVVGKYRQLIETTINSHIDTNVQTCNIKYVNQPHPIGTGNAIMCSLNELHNYTNCKVLILSGDTPLVSSGTMEQMLNSKDCLAMVVNCSDKDKDSKFKDYGKAVCNNNHIEQIIEKKDCNDDQSKIRTVNCGIYSYTSEVLLKCVPLISNNNSQKEYYLTDIVSIANNLKYTTCVFTLDSNKQYEIIGINTQDQLKELEKSWNT